MAEGKWVVRHYPTEFKVDAVKLLEEQGYTVSEAANSLGIPPANLTKWRKQNREGALITVAIFSALGAWNDFLGL